MAIRCKNCGRWLTPEETGMPCPRCNSLDRINLATEQGLAEDKAATARLLADKHFQAESGLQKIFRLTSTAAAEFTPIEPIKLLEVNAQTVASGVLPIQFGPSPASGIPYPSIIVEVTPDEFKKIQTQELKLPSGWKLGEELLKASDNGGGV